jgi:hypothetical protein
MENNLRNPGESKKEAANRLLLFWRPDVREEGKKNTLSGSQKNENKLLELADPEEFLAEILEFLPDVNENEIEKGFKNGITKVIPCAENYDSSDIQTELSKNLARLILGYEVDNTDLLHNEIQGKDNEKLYPLIRVINKALASRTATDFRYSKYVTKLKDLIFKTNAQNPWDMKTYEYLNREDFDPQISQQAKILLARLEKIQKENGKSYDPNLFLLDFDEGENLKFIEDQINYLEKFAQRHKEYLDESEEPEKKAEQETQLNEKIQEAKKNLDSVNHKILFLINELQAQIQKAKNSTKSLENIKNTATKVLNEAQAIQQPGFFGNQSKYLNDLYEKLKTIIDNVTYVLENEAKNKQIDEDIKTEYTNIRKKYYQEDGNNKKQNLYEIEKKINKEENDLKNLKEISNSFKDTKNDNTQKIDKIEKTTLELIQKIQNFKGKNKKESNIEISNSINKTKLEVSNI